MDTTLLLAIATFFLALFAAWSVWEARKARKLIIERPRTLELIVTVIDPLSKSVDYKTRVQQSREYRWSYWSNKPEIIEEQDLQLFQLLTGEDYYYIPDPDLKLEWGRGGFFEDLEVKSRKLVETVRRYNDLERQEEFKQLLISLAREILLSPQVKGEVSDSSRTFCAQLALNSLLMSKENLDDISRHISVPRKTLGGRLEEAKEFWKQNGGILTDKLREDEIIASKLNQINEQSKDMLSELEGIRSKLQKVKAKLMREQNISPADIEQREVDLIKERIRDYK